MSKPVFLMESQINKVHYSSCPGCGSSNIGFRKQITDYSVSRQQFDVWDCKACTLHFTQDVPDSDSIGPYYASVDYVSHSDTEAGLVNNLYQRVKKITIRQKTTMIERLSNKRNGHILDIGCGTGSFLAAMKEAGWKITGLEPDEGARKLAAEKTGEEIAAPDQLNRLEAKSFDVITLWHVLEHVHDLQGYIKSFSNLLAPGGVLIIAVPNYTSCDAGFYKEHWAAWDVPRHLYHFSPLSVGELFNQHGFSVTQRKPMWFDSFYVSMLSEKYKGGNFVRAMLVGGWSNIKALLNNDRCSSLIYIIKKR